MCICSLFFNEGQRMKRDATQRAITGYSSWCCFFSLWLLKQRKKPRSVVSFFLWNVLCLLPRVVTSFSASLTAQPVSQHPVVHSSQISCPLLFSCVSEFSFPQYMFFKDRDHTLASSSYPTILGCINHYVKKAFLPLKVHTTLFLLLLQHKGSMCQLLGISLSVYNPVLI